MYSGVILSIFITLHLSNHLLSLAGAPVHIAVMEELRSFYHIALFEFLILSACIVQSITGLGLIRKKGLRPKGIFNKLQVYSGLYLAIFCILHPAALKSYQYAYGIDTNYYFGALTVNFKPFIFFFIPYYMLGVISYFTHMACMLRNKMLHRGYKGNIDKQAKILIALGILMAFLIIFGFTDYGKGVEFPKDYLILLDNFGGN